MKRIFAVIVILAVGLSFAACADKPAEDIAYGWPVVIQVGYTYINETVTNEMTTAIEGYLQELDKDGLIPSAWVDTEKKTMTVRLSFENYKSFLTYNGLATEESDLKIVKAQHKEGAIFVEQTLQFKNPYEKMKAEKLTEIRNGIILTGFNLGEEPSDIHSFVLTVATRLTSAAGAYQTENNIEHWNYYYYCNGKNPVTDIELYFKSANQPTWYAIGIGATVLFMLCIYGVLRLVKNRQQPKVVIE